MTTDQIVERVIPVECELGTIVNCFIGNYRGMELYLCIFVQIYILKNE